MPNFFTAPQFFYTLLFLISNMDFSRFCLGYYVVGQRGRMLLNVNGHKFVKNRTSPEKIYWICCKKGTTSCRARVITKNSGKNIGEELPEVIGHSGTHNHDFVVPRKPRIKPMATKDEYGTL